MRNAARRFFIGDDELVDLYVTQKLPSRAIAQKYGVHCGTVLHRLRKLGVVLRGRKSAPPDTARLISLYEKGLSGKEVANVLGCCSAYVINTLARQGIPRRRCGRHSSSVCKVRGCKEPAAKFMRGEWECGSVCLQHRRDKAAKAARELHRRIRALPEEFWRRPEDIPTDHPKRNDLIWLKQAKKELKALRKIIKPSN